jgi:hypothetical protein
MADMVRICPFQEVESGNKFGPHPNAIAHLPYRQSLSPTATLSLWKIHERTDRCNKRFEPRENVTARGGNEASANARNVQQLLTFIEADY